MTNSITCDRFDELFQRIASLGGRAEQIEGAKVIDAGVACHGGLGIGIGLADLCMGGLSSVQLVPVDRSEFVVGQAVFVQTDQPLLACLGCQYAGWPVKADDYFAMGSGPMRMVRGREAVLTDLDLLEAVQPVVGVLESETLPTNAAVKSIAEDCGLEVGQLRIAVAPSTSVAGSVQVVARSVETAMHKLHELKFDVKTIVSATGLAPLPPPAKRGDVVGGIGRTNDAMLYGANVSLWVDHDDDAVADVIEKVPSCSSTDHGRPFAKVFKDYQYDFYRVDPLLFSPAVVTIHNLRSGRTWTAGRFEAKVLRESFLT